jgi:hypothetical protein
MRTVSRVFALFHGGTRVLDYLPSQQLRAHCASRPVPVVMLTLPFPVTKRRVIRISSADRAKMVRHHVCRWLLTDADMGAAFRDYDTNGGGVMSLSKFVSTAHAAFDTVSERGHPLAGTKPGRSESPCEYMILMRIRPSTLAPTLWIG